MATLNFNDIEWEVLDTLVAKRYSKFLEENIANTKQIFYMGETETQIKDEIEKIAYLKGVENLDINNLDEIFEEYEEDEDLQRLNHLIHYYEIVKANYPPRWGFEPTNSCMELFPADYDEQTVTMKYGYLYLEEPARTNFFCWLGKEIPALNMGYIPFAKLKTRINSNELVNHLLKMKGKTNYMELFNG